MTNLTDRLIGIIDMHHDAVAPASYDFLRRVFSDGLNKYEARLRQYGFTGLSNVLDAGCGFGQWSLALAGMNESIYSMDIAEDRIAFLRDAARELDIANLQARTGVLDQLPYDSGSFDGLFCYGAFMFSSWRESVHELARVMRSRGRLYLNANGFGWYRFLWDTQHNKVEGYDPREHVAKALLATAQYQQRKPISFPVDKLIEPSELTAALDAAGFDILEVKAEGLVGLKADSDALVLPFFVGDYKGDPGVYEILAVKR